jgi:signal transduction histidine kinase
MPSGSGVEESAELVRAEYAELARKYAHLVERLDRATRDLALYRLGSFGLRVSAAALALVGNGRIQMSNGRFMHLARSVRGPLHLIEPENGVAYPDLRTLVLKTAEKMLRKRLPAAESRYRDSGSDALLSVRLERNLQTGSAVVMVVAEDVTEQARRDQDMTRTREALLRRERLRVLGEMAVSIAHDLGNTLRGASFQLAALRQQTLPHEKRDEAVNAVAQRVEIASEAIARLHDFARTGTLGIAAVRLDRIVAQAVALVDIDFRASGAPVDVRSSIPDLPPVRGSISELSLLFVNLLRNARDAMPDGGTVTIAAKRAKRSVLVTVADQGTGLRSDVRRRMFEPFFTTKGGRGTGLGLWLAAGTMERLGGSIRAANRGRRGTLVSLIFPLDQVSPPIRRRASPTRRRATGRVRSAHATDASRRGSRI